MKKLTAITLAALTAFTISATSVALPENALAAPTLHISTVEQWNNFAADVTNGNTFAGTTVLLDNDISFKSQNVQMAGAEHAMDYSFAGTFDGQNHTISDITPTAAGYVGLFYNVTGTIENLNVTNVTMQSSGAALTANLAAGAMIDNCMVSGNISDKNTTAWDRYPAGVAGSVAGTVRNTRSEVNVTSTQSDDAGGITAQLSGTGKILNSANYGVIDGNYNTSTYSNGGIAGRALQNGAVIDNCISTGKVNGKNAAGLLSFGDAAITHCFMLTGICNDASHASGQAAPTYITEDAMTGSTLVNLLNANLSTGYLTWATPWKYKEVTKSDVAPDPTTPTNPTQPAEPTQPTNPVQPANPTQPTDPTPKPVTKKSQSISGVKSSYTLTKKKSSARFTPKAKATVSGKLTGKAKKNLTLKKSGKTFTISRKKSAKKGTYTVTFTAASNKTYKSAKKTIKIKVK